MLMDGGQEVYLSAEVRFWIRHLPVTRSIAPFLTFCDKAIHVCVCMPEYRGKATVVRTEVEGRLVFKWK